jgi:hypothetical protein
MSPPAGGQISIESEERRAVAAGQVLLELWHKDLHAQEELAQEQLRTTGTCGEVCAMAEAAQRELSVQCSSGAGLSHRNSGSQPDRCRARKAS